MVTGLQVSVLSSAASCRIFFESRRGGTCTRRETVVPVCHPGRLAQLAERGCRQTSFSPLGQLRPGQGWSEVAREKDVTWFWWGWDGSDRPYALSKKSSLATSEFSLRVSSSKLRDKNVASLHLNFPSEFRPRNSEKNVALLHLHVEFGA